MCGINGILRLDARAAPVDREELLTTRDRMAARGPDGSGLWIADDRTIGLGHRRLAIIDLSDAGLQPMATRDGRYRIVFNGEIYNYRELRAELLAAGARFESHSDTEVVLESFARRGVDSFSGLRGMYALAIWDAAERRLVLARDPYGIKPLYYSVSGTHLRFASQLKALEAGGAIGSDVDPAGLAGFLLWGSVPEPFTLRREVRCLPAGHYLVAADGRAGAPQPHARLACASRDDDGSAAVDALEDSVRAHLVADVPVAVFLSSGLDSSLLAALARRAADDPPTTLTLKFDAYVGSQRDEAPLAAEVARVLGTRHVERFVKREDFLDLWPAALHAMDQPSVDGFNTYVVSQAAHREGFKVVLSGVGGDELLGGYRSFPEVPRWSRWAAALDRLPGVRRVWPAAAGVRPSTPKLAGLIEYGTTLPGAYFVRRALYLPEELGALIGAGTAADGLAAYDPVADAGKYLGPLPDHDGWQAVHLMESSQYMRNQLLRDSDWASMAHSLELRVPLVDARLQQSFAAADFRPARDGGKAAAIRAAAPELPASLWSRPKTGFSIPVMEWLDERIDPSTAPGLASRALALRVLEAFGVELAERVGRGD
ncbi:MAG TPA: asparagine synthase (glutamine-hydrolyzing) [Candidatus Polarisedimenticolaceae bacterium]|nr:asparagine synthase (glutamine-hydrolyzing) [Candidatus Polarisedimenticolaceae bacterium]